VRHRSGSVGSTHVVRMVGQWTVVRICRRTPSIAVNVVVVGVDAVVRGVVVVANEGVVRRHGPVEVGSLHGAAESQVLSCAIHAVAYIVEKPDAREVDRHVYFLAGISIIAIKPNLVVFAIDGFCPHFVDYHIGGELVFVTAVNHELRLCVEGVGHADGLWTSEITSRICGCCECHCYQRQCQDEFFHGLLLSFD